MKDDAEVDGLLSSNAARASTRPKTRDLFNVDIDDCSRLLVRVNQRNR